MEKKGMKKDLLYSYTNKWGILPKW